jgi:hypothetical protein
MGRVNLIIIINNEGQRFNLINSNDLVIIYIWIKLYNGK